MNQSLFLNRTQAGRELAKKIQTLDLVNPLIMAIPRGGVVVGEEVSRLLQIPLEIVMVRKIGLPSDREYAIGAMSEDGQVIFNPQIFHSITEQEEIKKVVNEEKRELQRRLHLYKSLGHDQSLNGISVLVIDDGLATSMTALAAGKYLRSLGPLKLILCVPVAPENIFQDLHQLYDDVLILKKMKHFQSVGQFYLNFKPVEDTEVLSILHEKSRRVDNKNLGT